MNDKSADRSPTADPSAEQGSFRRTYLVLPYLLFQVVSRLSSDLLEHARPVGITVARFRVLAQLVDRDGLRIRDLVDECAVEQSAMSRVVDQLERDGMVIRRVGGSDNRAVTVWLTAKGRKSYAKTFPHALDVVMQSIANLDEEEIHQLIDLLQRMLKSFGKEVEPIPCHTHGGRFDRARPKPLSS